MREGADKVKREITVDGKASDWFEKAVFTLKDEPNKGMPKDLFSYAEELVERHLKRFPDSRRKEIGSVNMEKERKAERLVQSMQEAYQLQSSYRELKKKERYLKNRERQIHLFFVVAVSICIISIIVLLLTMLYG